MMESGWLLSSARVFLIALGPVSYTHLDVYKRQAIPRMLLTDTQINSVAKAYINDDNFGSLGRDLSMWKFYNLLTGSNKSSYIDSFLDRAYNATELATGIALSLIHI